MYTCSIFPFTIVCLLKHITPFSRNGKRLIISLKHKLHPALRHIALVIVCIHMHYGFLNLHVSRSLQISPTKLSSHTHELIAETCYAYGTCGDKHIYCVYSLNTTGCRLFVKLSDHSTAESFIAGFM